jgi:hypothetical protein
MAMDRFLPLDAAALGRIRKTAEDPPRVSVYDVISAVVGESANPRQTFARLRKEHSAVVAGWDNLHKFPGSGQRPTPVVDARGAVEILMLLPGRVAAHFRRSAADVIVRYLGGDPSLVDEVAANRLIQEQLPEDHPSRIFGQTVESEQVKRAREELEVGRLKRARLEDLSQSVRLYFETMAAIGVEADDRDRMHAKDRLSSAFLDRQAVEDGEFCIRDVTSAAGYRDSSVDAAVGKLAKRLYLQDHPTFEFPKKSVYANGQLISVNLWRQSQRSYVDRAIQQLQQEGRIRSRR